MIQQKLFVVWLLLLALTACAAPTGGGQAVSSPTLLPPTATTAPSAPPSATSPQITLTFIPTRVTLSPTSPTPTATMSPDGWVTLGHMEVELRHPMEWEAHEGGIDFASISQLGPLKLLVFGEFPAGSFDTPMLSPEETRARFRETLVEGATITTRTVNGVEIEIIRYTTISDYIIYTNFSAPGTIALWGTAERSYVLIDEGNTQQENGVFDRVVDSIHLKEP